MIMITIILSSIFGLQNNVCTLLSFDISLFQKLGKVLYACIRGLALRTKALRGATAPAWLSRFNSHTAEALHMLTVYGFSWPEKFSWILRSWLFFRTLSSFIYSFDKNVEGKVENVVGRQQARTITCARVEAINKLDFNILIIMSNMCKCHPNPLDSKEPLCGLVTSAKDVGSIS